MFIWTLLLGGPLILPLVFLFRPDLPQTLAEVLLVIGVVSLFLSICAAEAIGTGAQAKRASD